MLQPLLILFAKAPIAGRVKTRLCPPLTSAEAASLHHALVRDTAAMLLTFEGAAEIEISTDVETDAWADLPARKSLQPAGDLGMRMLAAVEQGLGAGHEKVIILGGDSPGLPDAHVSALLRSQADVAMGPTLDGGYYAIACRATNRGMFSGVRWSTEYALADTEAALSSCGLSVEIGPAWFDIDRGEDLRLLLNRADVPLNTRNWLERNPHMRKI